MAAAGVRPLPIDIRTRMSANSADSASWIAACPSAPSPELRANSSSARFANTRQPRSENRLWALL